MTFTAWDVLVDAGCVCGLLLVGTLIRATVGAVQKLLLPASILAGLLALAFGPRGAGLLPFSEQFDTYTTILNAVVFGALPLTGSFALRGKLRGARLLWSYSVSNYMLQWGLGVLFAVAVLSLFFELPTGFGLLLATGFVGGFGMAAAVGTTMSASGWTEATSLAFTSATIGVVVAIVGGLLLARWGIKTGRAHVAGSFAELPAQMRTGLVRDPAEREPLGYTTMSASSLDPLAFQLALVTVVTLAGYLTSSGIEQLFPDVSVPVFAAAFVCGLIARLLLDQTPARHYLDGTTMKSISGSATDLLVTVGIASIVPSIVIAYAVPLALLLLFGVLFCLLVFRYLAPKMFTQLWLERGLFTWGWTTGAVATGLALLKIVDPKSTSGTVEEFGFAYVGFAPVEIAMAIIAPLVVLAGFSGSFIAVTLAVGVGLLVLTFALRWPTRDDIRTSITKHG